MTHPKAADLEALLEALVGVEVEFVIVGGVAAVLHGAPVTTPWRWPSTPKRQERHPKA